MDIQEIASPPHFGATKKGPFFSIEKNGPSVVIIKQLKQYGKSCRTYQLKAFCEAVPPELNELLQKAKEELKVKKPVKLICSRLCDTPMALGVFSPTIVVPAPKMTNFRPNDLSYILKHELLHIKSQDLLIKFLALFALAIHWYNPIYYFLYRELCVVSGLDCDYGVLKDLDDIGYQQYGDLLIDLAVTGHNRRNWFAVGLVNNEVIVTERRILEMKQTGKNRKPILACIVMAMICVMGTMTAFAYEAPVRYGSENDWTEYDDIFFQTIPKIQSILYTITSSLTRMEILFLWMKPSHRHPVTMLS